MALVVLVEIGKRIIELLGYAVGAGYTLLLLF